MHRRGATREQKESSNRRQTPIRIGDFKGWVGHGGGRQRVPNIDAKHPKGLAVSRARWGDGGRKRGPTIDAKHHLRIDDFKGVLELVGFPGGSQTLAASGDKLVPLKKPLLDVSWLQASRNR